MKSKYRLKVKTPKNISRSANEAIRRGISLRVEYNEPLTFNSFNDGLLVNDNSNRFVDVEFHRCAKKLNEQSRFVSTNRIIESTKSTSIAEKERKYKLEQTNNINQPNKQEPGIEIILNVEF